MLQALNIFEKFYDSIAASLSKEMLEKLRIQNCCRMNEKLLLLLLLLLSAIVKQDL